MSLKLPNDKIVYNLSEQVGVNAENIKYLAEVYKEIDSIPAQYAELKQDNEETMGGYATTMGDYATTMGGYANTMNGYATTMGGYALTMAGYQSTMDGYALQVASWASAMSSACVAAITGQNIAPANITSSGNLTANSIIENMTGYWGYDGSLTVTNITKEILYFGMVKNGNKLTISCFFKITRTGAVSNDSPVDLVSFHIPNTIASKIVVSNYGGNNACDVKVIQCCATINEAPVDTNAVLVRIGGGGYTSYDIRLYRVGNLTANTEYLARYEVTFLLSDNLAA